MKSSIDHGLILQPRVFVSTLRIRIGKDFSCSLHLEKTAVYGQIFKRIEKELMFIHCHRFPCGGKKREKHIRFCDIELILL